MFREMRRKKQLLSEKECIAILKGGSCRTLAAKYAPGDSARNREAAEGGAL